MNPQTDPNPEIAFYRALLDAQSNAGIGLFVIEGGRIVFSNEAVRNIYGYSDEELRALPSFDRLVHPADRALVVDNYRRRLAGERFGNRYDIGILTKAGERREAEISVTVQQQGHNIRLLVILIDITARKRAQDAVRLSEERFAKVFHVSPVAASIARAADGTFIEVNDVYRRDFGWSKEEMIGRTSAELGLWPDESVRRPWVDELRRKGTLLDYETVWPHKSGEPRNVRISAVMIEFGGESCILALLHDITGQRHAEGMLREIVEGTSRVTGTEFFHALVRHLARALEVPFALVGEVRPGDGSNLHTLAFWAEDRFIAETDYDLATTPCGLVFGQEPRLFACDLAAHFPQAACTMRTLGADSYYGYPLTSVSGEPLGVLAIMDNQPLESNDERASLMSIFAARAAAELERQRAEIGIRQSERKFSHIFHASPVAISISRLADGRYIEVNDAYVRQFGWKRDEILGRSAQEIGLWADPDMRRPWVEILRRENRLSGHEALLHDRAGNERLVLISAEILDLDGEECALSFLYDITERKHAEAEIRQLNAELEERVRSRTAELTEANRELESFAYSISHDLRAPLRGVDGFSRLLQEEYGDRLDNQGNEYLMRVRRATQRLGTLIDDLLELSRVTRHEMRRVRVDLSALVADIVEDLRKAEPERLVDVRIEAQCATNGDPQLLRVLLENLVGNAWKYSRRNKAARIEFGSERTAEETRYFVRDNGVGFDMAYMDKLFAPFQRLHSPTEFEGSGIGLASAARVVRRHGGHIWAESTPGEGAIFRFTLDGHAEE